MCFSHFPKNSQTLSMGFLVLEEQGNTFFFSFPCNKIGTKKKERKQNKKLHSVHYVHSKTTSNKKHTSTLIFGSSKLSWNLFYLLRMLNKWEQWDFSWLFSDLIEDIISSDSTQLRSGGEDFVERWQTGRLAIIGSFLPQCTVRCRLSLMIENCSVARTRLLK